MAEFCNAEGKSLMTSRVYAIGLQGLEPPVPPAPMAAGASREERASYGESMSMRRQQVREFCNSLTSELTRTGRPPLQSYLHTAQDGTPQLRLSVFEFGIDAAAALERVGAEFLYTEDSKPSVERHILRIPATFQHQTVGQVLTPEQIRHDGISRRRLAAAIRRQAFDGRTPYHSKSPSRSVGRGLWFNLSWLPRLVLLAGFAVDIISQH